MKYLIRNSVFALAASAFMVPSAFAVGTTNSTSSDTTTSSESTGTAESSETDTTSGTTAPTTTTTTTAPAAATVADAGTRYQVIDFKEGSAEIAQVERQKLRTLVDNAKAKGQIAKVHVAVWSDKSFPKEGQNLAKTDRKLVKMRASNLEKYLEDSLAVSHVEMHNMAERAGFVARNFNKADAELKSAFAKRGAAPMSNEDFQIIKQMGAPSKAVVVVELSESSSSGEKSY
jgi:hypothetical protein